MPRITMKSKCPKTVSKVRINKDKNECCDCCGKDADQALAGKPWERYWFMIGEGDAACFQCHKELLAEPEEPEQTPEEEARQAARAVQSCDIYAKVLKTHECLAGKITAALMEMSAQECSRLMTDSAFFARKVEEAAACYELAQKGRVW